MDSKRPGYIPGVCNIGREEIKQRKAAGWFGLVATVVLWGALIAIKAEASWRLLLFVPATLSAIGFLQSAWHFCAKFGLSGAFKFGSNVGRSDTVEQAEFRRLDRRKAVLIIGLSAFVGLVVAVAAYFIPL